MWELRSLRDLNKSDMIINFKSRRMGVVESVKSAEDLFQVTSREMVEEFNEFGYRIFREISLGLPEGMYVAYTLNNEYIGDVNEAEYLCKKRGIVPETYEGCKVCSIGYSEKEKKYFGWSHRAIYGFSVGDEVREGDITAGSLRVGFKAVTFEDTRLMAIAFAKGVS